MQPNIETLRLVVGTIVRRPRADELIDWAIERLLHGDESPVTAELAALDPIESRTEEALPIFRRLLAQDGIRLEDEVGLLKAYFHCLLREIAIGKLDPLVGTGRIRSEIISTGLYSLASPSFLRWYDERLRDWVLLHGGLSPRGMEIPKDELPNVIRDAAAHAIDSASSSQ